MPNQLRLSFDPIAEAYDRARPTYPPALFDALAQFADLHREARIVEIGCGTGQATQPLAERGYQITCVELGSRLAAVARQKLEAFPAVNVVTADFETWQPEEAADFDAVVAFTSFHWITPTVRYTKTAELLGTAGKLAVVSTAHVLPPDGDRFFAEVQADYEAVVPDDPSTKAGAGGPPPPDVVNGYGDEIAESGRFRNIGERRYLWDVTYTSGEYLAVLNTYSGHLALADHKRGELFDRIRHRIEQRPDPRVRKTYLAVLNVAERL